MAPRVAPWTVHPIARSIRQATRALGLATAIAAAAAEAQTAPPTAHAPAGAPRVELINCAGGPTLTLEAGDPRALLAEDERDALLAEMLARYPFLERHGFAPAVILMWRRSPNEWLYVSLQPNAFTSDGTLCFTASFVAQVFEVTPTLMRKYF